MCIGKLSLFVSSITNTHYFILTTQHKSDLLVHSWFSLKWYKTNGYSQSEPSRNDRYLPYFGIMDRIRIISGLWKILLMNLFEVQEKRHQGMYFWVLLHKRKFKLENDVNSKDCAASYTSYWSDFHIFYFIE